VFGVIVISRLAEQFLEGHAKLSLKK
jgi:hypothetical protein